MFAATTTTDGQLQMIRHQVVVGVAAAIANTLGSKWNHLPFIK